MKRLEQITRNIILLIFGTGFITLSGINWNIGLASWLAPLFLLPFVRTANWYRLVFLYLALFAAGFISQTGNNLLHLPVIDVINGVSFAIFSSLAYIIDRSLYKEGKPFYYSLIFPSAIVMVEFSVSSLIGTWGVIAHTQFAFKPLIQLASLAGIYSISFVVAWFSSATIWIIENKKQSKKIYQGIGIYLGILILILILGLTRLHHPSPNNQTTNIALILSENDVHQLAKNEKEILTKLSTNRSLKIPERIFSDSLLISSMIHRTTQAANQGAKIIVWNEASLIVDQKQKEKLNTVLKEICKNYKAYILMSIFEECTNPDQKLLNNISTLISSDGELVWKYLKAYLHPYAEAPLINKGTAKIPVCNSSYGVLANVICADMDRNNYIRQAAKQNAAVLLVPAFDWEGITPLHAQMSCIHAIQYGLNIVRANGKGQSTVYDCMGNTIITHNTFTSDSKIIQTELPLKSAKTIYTLTGDFIVYLGIAFLLFIIILRISKKGNYSN